MEVRVVAVSEREGESSFNLVYISIYIFFYNIKAIYQKLRLAKRK